MRSVIERVAGASVYNGLESQGLRCARWWHCPELHQTVDLAIEDGQLDRPRRLCEAILDRRPDNLETILLLAEIRLEAGDDHSAIDGFERVIAGVIRSAFSPTRGWGSLTRPFETRPARTTGSYAKRST